MYGRIGCTKAFSYIEPRITNETMLVVGRQIWLKNFKPITMEMIDQAEEFFAAHIVNGREIFPRADWELVVKEFGGYPPLRIRGLPEGMKVPSQNAISTIEVDEDKYPQLAWMGAYFETAYLRAEWYPVTVASRSLKVRNIIKRYLEETSDVGITEAIAFMFHDFGARGVSSKESAGIGGFAHLSTGALGTDTITGALYANEYYKCAMSAFSVFATEHSIMTMRGKEGELKTVNELIDEFGRFGPGTIVSIVSDGYDIFNLSRAYCTGDLKEKILKSGIRLVVRPDSGNAVEVILKLLKIFEEGYGVTVNSKNYKVLNVVRILQGDGLSHPSDFEAILASVKEAGFSVENLAFGQGGGLLQQVNRDTYKFAMKTCAAYIDGKWVDVFKDPVTDAGKRSKKGRLTTVRLADGSIATVPRDHMPEGSVDLMVDIWYAGNLLVEYTLDEIRERANA
jgi:nicotinamide phosphoribosyltransferase